MERFLTLTIVTSSGRTPFIFVAPIVATLSGTIVHAWVTIPTSPSTTTAWISTKVVLLMVKTIWSKKKAKKKTQLLRIQKTSAISAYIFIIIINVNCLTKLAHILLWQLGIETGKIVRAQANWHLKISKWLPNPKMLVAIVFFRDISNHNITFKQSRHYFRKV